MEYSWSFPLSWVNNNTVLVISVQLMEQKRSQFFAPETPYIIWAMKVNSSDIPFTFWNTQWLIWNKDWAYAGQKLNYFPWLSRLSRQWFTICCASASLTPSQDSVSSPLVLLCLSEGGKKVSKQWHKDDKMSALLVWSSACLVVVLWLCQTTLAECSECSVHVLPLSCQTIHMPFTELSQWVSVLSPSRWWIISQFPHVNCNFFSENELIINW